MFRFRLPTTRNQIELVASGADHRIPFQVLGPTTEAAFIEELIEEEFGSLTVNPKDLFTFLQSDPWVRGSFQEPVLIDGNLDQAAAATQGTADVFAHQPLGKKLLQSGVLRVEELDGLLQDYQPFSQTQRFGEFLRLNLKVSSELLDFMVNPASYGDKGFNEKRLGEKLLELGLISQSALNDALTLQRQKGGRIGEVLCEQGHISPQIARFFSEARITAEREVVFNPEGPYERP